MLVDGQHLLTARHVLGTSRSDDAARTTVVFPRTGATFEVEIVDLSGPGSPDLAVLRVLDPDALPKPVDVWSGDRLPDAVSAFGFPQAERRSVGVWRSFTVSGQTTSGIRQLCWDEGVGTFVGHSGGPVIDKLSKKLVGILLAGSEKGRFDRFIAVPQIAEIWPELPRPRPWWYAGKNAKSHFSRSGHRFQGRADALNAIATYLRGNPPGCPLVIVGQPGSGKSAVLAQAALDAERAGGRGLVYHARDSSLDGFLDAIAGFLGLETPEDIGDLIEKIDPDTTFTVLVDALDEASVGDTNSIADAIAELSYARVAHAVVATRPRAAGNRVRPGSILASLRVSESPTNHLIDLDVEPYRDRAAIQAFVSATLAQEGAHRPGPDHGAWEIYRAREDLRSGLSKIIAQRADPNFLVASIASLALSRDSKALDYNDPTFANSIPSNLGEALEKYYDSIAGERQQRVKALLAALAYARGSGISNARWMTFTRALEYSVTREDIDWFRASPGVDYLVETESGDGGDPTVRLFHQALVDQLRLGRWQSDDQKIYKSLCEDVAKTSGGWSSADAYLTTHIADHALACSELANLLKDCEYIGVADMAALVSALGALAAPDCPEIGHLILQEGLRLGDFGRDMRLWLLAISATHAGDLKIRDELLSERTPYLFPAWADPLDIRHQKLTGEKGHKGPVHALAIGRLGRADVIVSGGMDKTIRVWGHRGNLLFGPLEGHRGNVTALTVGVLNGDDVIISGSADKTVRVWDQNGEPVGPEPFVGHTEPVTAVQIIKFNDQDAVVSAAPKGQIIVWNTDGKKLREPRQLGSPLVAIGVLGEEPSIVSVDDLYLSQFSPDYGHRGSVQVQNSPKTALAIGRLRKTDVVVCGLGNASVAVWNADGFSILGPLLGHERPAQSLAVGRLGVTDVVASGSQDNSLVIWDLSSGQVLFRPRTGHAGKANAVTIGSLKGRDVVACGGDDRVVRIWDDRTLRSRGRTNTRERIRALAAGMILGDFRIVTTTGSGIEFWDAHGKPVTEPCADDDVDVKAITIGQLSCGDAIVLGGKDRKIHIWDSKGRRSGEPIVGHGKEITAVAIGSHDGRPVIASASSDRTIRIWDEDGSEIDCLEAVGPSGAGALAFGRFDDRDSLVVRGSDNLVRVWDLDARKWVHRLPGSPSGSVACLTLCRIGGGDIIAVGGSDGRIRTWQPGQKEYRVSQERHAAHISALAFLDVAGSPALVSAGADGVLRVWSDMRRSDTFPLSEPATRIAIAGSRIVIASGPALSMLRYNSAALGPKSRNPNNDDSFTSTSELVIDDSADLTGVEVVAVSGKGSDKRINYARKFLEDGDADEAVAQLLPHLAHRPDAVGLAAEAALASWPDSLIETVMPHLEHARMRSLLSIQGRLFALAVVVGRPDAARAASAAIGTSLDAVVKEMIELFDRGDPEREWLVYRCSASALREGSFDDEFTFAHYIADVAAMRLLAVCRRGAGADIDLFVRRRDSLLEEYWDWFDDGVEKRLAAMLSAYVASPEDHPGWLPYQMISVYDVLRSIAQEDLDLREQLVDTLARGLQPKPSKVRSAFAAWAEYSDLAAAVVTRLAELGAA